MANKETKEYILLLEDRYRNSDIAGKQVLRVIKGGIDTHLQGTWMDEKLALKFARALRIIAEHLEQQEIFKEEVTSRYPFRGDK